MTSDVYLLRQAYRLKTAVSFDSVPLSVAGNQKIPAYVKSINNSLRFGVNGALREGGEEGVRSFGYGAGSLRFVSPSVV